MARRRSGRRKIRRSKTTSIKRSSHRDPPKPIHWDCDRGFCRFCGEIIIDNGIQNRRKHWHTECVENWAIINTPARARHHVFLREKGTCQGCGTRSVLMSDFDVDHIKPLFEANGDMTYWQSPNLQLLCKTCHKIKTKEDMVRFRATKTNS